MIRKKESGAAYFVPLFLCALFFLPIAAQDHPNMIVYKGLDNVRGYLKARNQYIIEYLRGLEAGRVDLNTKNVEINSNGTITVHSEQRPDLVRPTMALWPLFSLNQENIDTFKHDLMKRGFPSEDLTVIDGLLTENPLDAIDSARQKALWSSPLRPILEKLVEKEPITEVELLRWTNENGAYYQAAMENWAASFLEKLSLTGRRVLLSQCLEGEFRAVTVGLPENGRFKRITAEQLEEFNANVRDMSDEVIASMRRGRQ